MNRLALGYIIFLVINTLTAPASGQETDSSPGNGFKEIVGARYQVETVAVRDSTATCTGRAQVSKSNVS